MWAKTSRLLVVGAVFLAGCGGSKPVQASAPSGYPAAYKEAFFREHECGSGGYSVANCECQIRYIEAHAPYSALEEGSPEHAKAEEAMNEAGSHCSEESHTPAEEEAHNSAVKAKEGEARTYSEQEQKDKPEQEHLREIEEKVRYERGE